MLIIIDIGKIDMNEVIMTLHFMVINMTKRRITCPYC